MSWRIKNQKHKLKFWLKGRRSKTVIFNVCLFTLCLIIAQQVYAHYENSISPFQISARKYIYIENKEILGMETIAANTFITSTKKQDIITTGKITSKPILIDKRSHILDQYFLSNASPLYGTGQLFVNACDRYGAPADCISVVAIAKHETNLCKYNISAEMHNCWGFGGAGPNRVKFGSFEEAINRVTDVLVNQYGLEYMIDPRKMERTFCGPQDECIGWGSRILSIMEDVDDFSETIGLGRLTGYNHLRQQ